MSIQVSGSTSLYNYILGDHHDKCSHHLSPNNVTTILLTILPVLYFSCLWFNYFVTGNLDLLIPLSTSPILPPTSPLLFFVFKNLFFVGFFLLCLFCLFFNIIYCQIGFHTTPSAHPKKCSLQCNHPLSPTPHPPSTLSLFSVCKSFLWFSSLPLCNVFPFPLPHGVLISFSIPTYEWNYMVSVFDWLISLSIIPSSSIYVAASGQISFFFIVK